MAFNFNQFKDLFSTIKEKGAQVAGVAADKTKDAARIAKLTMDLNTEKGSLEKAFLELGKAYYGSSSPRRTGLFRPAGPRSRGGLADAFSAGAGREDRLPLRMRSSAGTNSNSVQEVSIFCAMIYRKKVVY